MVRCPNTVNDKLEELIRQYQRQEYNKVLRMLYVVENVKKQAQSLCECLGGVTMVRVGP